MLSTTFDQETYTIPKPLENWKIIENNNSDAFLQDLSLSFNAFQDTQATLSPKLLVLYPSI